jgi:hypothetical protein
MKRIALEAEVIVRLDYSTDEAHVCVSSWPAMARKMERLFGSALDNKAGQSRRWKVPAGAIRFRRPTRRSKKSGRPFATTVLASAMRETEGSRNPNLLGEG